MPSFDDVAAIALTLPGVTEEAFGQGGGRGWKVRDKGFVWERPLRKGDLAALGDAAPKGAILGVRTADLAMKEALLASDPAVFFTIPHFEGYPAVLVQLGKIRKPLLRDIIVEAWLARAPARLANAYLAERDAAAPKQPVSRARPRSGTRASR